MVTTEHQGCSGKSKIPKDSGGSKPKSRIWRHHFHISPDYVPHMERVFSIVRKICDQKPTEGLKDLDVNTAIWCMFMCHTSSCSSSWTGLFNELRSVKNQSSKSVERFSRTTERLIKDQTETTGVSTVNWDQRMWRESSLLCDGAGRTMNSKTNVFSDSVLCLGGISPEPVQAWKDKIKWYFGNLLSQ